MSAPFTSLCRCCQRSDLLLVARRQWSSSSASPPLLSRLIRLLTQRFSDVEMLFNWGTRVRRNQLQKKNAYYSYTQRIYGPNVASAYYVLNMGGGFRYAGQSQWFCADRSGKFSWDFLNHRDSPLEEVDMSHTEINYRGLLNLERHSLRTLKLQGCPEVDDWFLARLHVFQESLEELDISHCSRITIGGLPALRNLKLLKRLDVSSLPELINPGLVIILLEEMLPHCQITAGGYDHSLKEAGEEVMEGQR